MFRRPSIDTSLCEYKVTNNIFDDNNPHAPTTQIYDWLYLGNISDANNISKNTQQQQNQNQNHNDIENNDENDNYKCIISCCKDKINHEPNIKYIQYPIDDLNDENIENIFYEFSDTLEELEKTHTKTLVHCVMGISRSPTLIMAFLIIKKHMTFTEAYDFVLSLRPIINVNLGFFLKLEQLGNDCMNN